MRCSRAVWSRADTKLGVEAITEEDIYAAIQNKATEAFQMSKG
jgi:hypothetical protein